MKKQITSRELLLEAAKKIAYQEGLSHLSIRRLAGDCGIAVGSVYNYFPSKSDLVFAVVEDFWRSVFHRDSSALPYGLPFPEFFARVYTRLRESLEDFESGFLQQIALLSGEEKEKGRAVEAHYRSHMQRGLCRALELDETIPPSLWTPEFSREAFAAFAFSNLFAMLRAGQDDCAFFCEILRRALR